MEFKFIKEKINVRPGDIVKRKGFEMDVYMVAKDCSEGHHLIDLSTGEVLDFGTYSSGELQDVAGLTLLSRNEDVIITNRK